MTTDPVEMLNQRNAEVAKIRGYADLTEEAKERRIAEVSERARAEYQEARETQKREREQRLEQSKKSVFAIGYPFAASDAEKAQIRAAYRSAYSDIESALAPSLGTDPAYTQETLERFLERAERTGDEELATAAYHTAIDLGIQSGLMPTWGSGRPRAGRCRGTQRRPRRHRRPRASGLFLSAA